MVVLSGDGNPPRYFPGGMSNAKVKEQVASRPKALTVQGRSVELSESGTF